jgi:transcription termination factor Rho
VDLIAPIGKGTRGLIVSPPKAGKTTLLSKLSNAIGTASPEARIVVLLIDERPEEVTYFRRGVDAEVIASSSDQPVREHMALMELMLAHIRVELECGRDVVVLLDSLTRLARAFNLGARGTGRSLSGGLDASAMDIPRRFFGLARNVEGGGSVTILGTILVDTGSRMDQLIFEELKATGNSEIVLDRALAQAFIFPAINIAASGTRREELLYRAEEMPRLRALRRALAGYPPREAMLKLLSLLEKYPTNAELLGAMRIAPKPPETQAAGS